jgi:RimJ/RimL family protein N-acetyltransferase
VIETQRLILRRWRESDRAPFAAMMADPYVGYWLGGTMTHDEADAYLERVDRCFEALGYGRFAVEQRAEGRFLGFVGLAPVHESYRGLAIAGGIEVGWRLTREAWGHGYATEAARAAVDDGFSHVGLPEIVSFTAASNQRSRAVMERLGLVRDPTRDFDHPQLAADHPLRPHVVYAALRPA